MSDTAPPPLSAAILAGGQSTRMGTDKARLRLSPDGPMLIELALAATHAVADDVFLVANDDRLAALGLRTVPDLHPVAGALGGIYSAVANARHDHCLVVACDMPFLVAPLLRALAAEPRDYDVLAPRLTVGENRQGSSDGVYETLHAIYGRAALPAIRAQLAGGRYRVIGFFPQVRVRAFPEETVRRLDPALRSFFNANTPERLAEARRLAGMAPR
ncbi:MAG: Molybdenum cofactor guanylyltransferase [uncultured Thermomicrobiales bacterium]|uniref:Probable molybdenum cofactor guanylyltransferase n=1 Tax=uncultured Thermomicrobiales bacterium TaxID=1645740 RepID=A0A6J4V879_9BACT|nr:MAG: Molybdenum cofactor guanylyltransferase [uncultured Thermomicrobiales bacterium]